MCEEGVVGPGGLLSGIQIAGAWQHFGPPFEFLSVLRSLISQEYQCDQTAEAHLQHPTPAAVLQVPAAAQSRHNGATACYCRSSQPFSLHMLHIGPDNTADAGTPCTEPCLQRLKSCAEMLDVPSRPATTFQSKKQRLLIQMCL
jgi:hypothetical protein